MTPTDRIDAHTILLHQAILDHHIVAVFLGTSSLGTSRYDHRRNKNHRGSRHAIEDEDERTSKTEKKEKRNCLSSLQTGYGNATPISR
jgi:hypothetical protein